MKDADVIDCVCQIIERVRKPMLASHLAAELRSRGIELTKSQLNKILYAPTNQRPGLRHDHQFRWTWSDPAGRPQAPLPEKLPSQRRLLAFLKAREAANATFTIEEAADSCGLKEISVRTYLSKKLTGRWVFPTDGQRYEVRGIAAASEHAFDAVMTQTARHGAETEAAWRAELERVVSEGTARGFRVLDVLLALAGTVGSRK